MIVLRLRHLEIDVDLALKIGWVLMVDRLIGRALVLERLEMAEVILKSLSVELPMIILNIITQRCPNLVVLCFPLFIDEF